MAATYDPEEEHLKRIMTSHNTAFRDAWSLMKAWNPNTQAPNDEPNKWGQTEPMPNPGIGEGQDWTWDIKWCKKCRAMYKPSSLMYDVGLCPDCARGGGTNMPSPFKDYPHSGPIEPDWGHEPYMPPANR